MKPIKYLESCVSKILLAISIAHDIAVICGSDIRFARHNTTKLARKVEKLLNRDKPLGSPQQNWLNIITQQLDDKLKVLSDMDKDILSQCKLDLIDAEIEESEAVVARIIDCKQQRYLQLVIYLQ